MGAVAPEDVSWNHPPSNSGRTRQRQAQAFDETRLINLTMSRMKKSIRKVRLRNRKALEFADRRDDELMRSMLAAWVREERSKLLERVIDSRRVRTSLLTWKNKLRRVNDLDGELKHWHQADISQTAPVCRRVQQARPTCGAEPMARCVGAEAQCCTQGRSHV
jgi:hypothetical protein